MGNDKAYDFLQVGMAGFHLVGNDKAYDVVQAGDEVFVALVVDVVDGEYAVVVGKVQTVGADVDW